MQPVTALMQEIESNTFTEIAQFENEILQQYNKAKKLIIIYTFSTITLNS